MSNNNRKYVPQDTPDGSNNRRTQVASPPNVKPEDLRLTASFLEATGFKLFMPQNQPNRSNSEKR